MKELAQAIERPPHQWTPEKLWQAYETLDRSRVRGSGERVLTDLVSLVRVALHQDDELVAYPELVRERFHAWLLQQENAGRDLHAPSSSPGSSGSATTSPPRSAISADDFAYTPFVEAGGLGRAAQVFGDELDAAARRAQRGARRVSELPPGWVSTDARRSARRSVPGHVSRSTQQSIDAYVD